MKVAVIFFHKNILTLYKKRWIEKCISSIKDQTFQDFDVFEVDYSGKNIKLCGTFTKHFFYNVRFDNHIGAMNFLLDEVFAKGYDVVFNTNMDDYYDPKRFELQLEKIKEGFNLVSSNFYYITELPSGKDIVMHHMNMTSYGDIRLNLKKNHNVIAHPCICMDRSMWESGLRYNDLLGYEDLDLWQRAHEHKFFILQDYLLYYRIHDNQITKTEYLK